MQIAGFRKLPWIVFNPVEFAFPAVSWLEQFLHFLKVDNTAEAHSHRWAVIPLVACSLQWADFQGHFTTWAENNAFKNVTMLPGKFRQICGLVSTCSALGCGIV